MGRQPEAPAPRRTPDRRTAASTRPRYARIVAACGAAAVTLVSVLGGTGLLPTATASAGQTSTRADARPASRPAAELAGAGTQQYVGGGSPVQPGSVSTRPRVDRELGQGGPPIVPPGTGTGRRVVFDIGSQRVWLVGRSAGEDVVRRTYSVSGSVTDNLDAGTYSVYSRSLHAWGVDDSGSMKYMVRFAHGGRAAIGFHDIPVLDGRFVQTRDELGSPRSHGCIRQWRPDARALWRFAPVGTKVVVRA